MSKIIQIGNRFYVPQVETVYIILEPIVNSQNISLRANAFCLQNAGNCDVVLSNGFTLAPGQNQWFGNYAELNVMALDIVARFQPSTTPPGQQTVQRLEIVQVLTKFTGSGFWIDQPTMKVTNTI